MEFTTDHQEAGYSFPFTQTLALDDGTVIHVAGNADTLDLMNQTLSYLLNRRKILADEQITIHDPAVRKAARQDSGKRPSDEALHYHMQRVRAQHQLHAQVLVAQIARWVIIANDLFDVQPARKGGVVITCKLGEVAVSDDYWETIENSVQATDKFAVLRPRVDGFRPRIARTDGYEYMLGVVSDLRRENEDFGSRLDDLGAAMIKVWHDDREGDLLKPDTFPGASVVSAPDGKHDQPDRG